MSERTFFINGVPSLYEALKKAGREEEAKKLLKDYLTRSFNDDLDKKVECFREIPGGIVPADMEYFRIYWELNQLYINRLFYSAAVLAGVLCERICYDILSNQKMTVARKELTKDQIACLYKINLVDIIRLLREWDLIKEKTMKRMLQINDKRNCYVHPTQSRPNARAQF